MVTTKTLKCFIPALLCFAAAAAAAGAPKPQIPLAFSSDKPQFLLTAEYISHDELLKPEVIALLKKYDVILIPCLRDRMLNQDLDRLFDAYEQAGVNIVSWPLLPRAKGLYLNKASARDFLAYLDEVYAWSQEYGHPIQGMIIDIEPAAGLSTREVFKAMDRKTFEAAKPEFLAIQEKLHEHGTIAVSTAMDMSVIDLMTGKDSWQDLQGGPTMSVEWDYVSFMHFNSSNYNVLRRLGFNWDDTRYLSYLLGREIYKKYGDKAGISLGVSMDDNPDRVHTPEGIRKDVEVLQAAGIKHFCIWDLEGILRSPTPEAWFKAVREAEPVTPKRSLKAECFLRNLKNASWILETMR